MCKTRYTYQNPFTKVYSIHVVCIIRLDLSQIVNHNKIKTTTKKRKEYVGLVADPKHIMDIKSIFNINTHQNKRTCEKVVLDIRCLMKTQFIYISILIINTNDMT